LDHVRRIKKNEENNFFCLFVLDFPRRKQPTNNSQQGISNTSIHTPFRPHFGMYFKTQLLETSKGRDLGLISYLFLSLLKISIF